MQHKLLCTAIGTAWTRQDHLSIQSIEPRQPEQLQAALEDALNHKVTAVKIGMVATSEIALAIVAALAAFKGPVVYDPVMAASNGFPLYSGKPDAMWALAQRATLVTPNLAEAGAFLQKTLKSIEDAQKAAHLLKQAGLSAVLVKGGHLEGEAVDCLVSDDGEQRFVLPRIIGPSPRGTGCALASAISVGLSQGKPLGEAIHFAKHWLTQRILLAQPVNETWHLG
jgi:hydroxymethylpyrimidine kinase/phosphomethylpyrimidine kinase